jgi:hypothetical protein
MTTRMRDASQASSRTIDLDRSGVIQLAGSAAGRNRIRINRHRDVWTLAGHGQPLGQVEPLTADLAERIGPALHGRPVVRRARTRLGVEHRSERRQQRLTRLGIEVAVHPHHPEQRD